MGNDKANWHNKEYDSAWDNVKNAFKNDWEQTKNDFGVDSARELNQDVDDTIKQAVGSDNAFENKEQAFRFGHAARQNFGSQHAEWNNDLETQLRNDYDGNFDQDRDYIRHSYNYNY